MPRQLFALLAYDMSERSVLFQYRKLGELPYKTPHCYVLFLSS